MAFINVEDNEIHIEHLFKFRFKLKIGKLKNLDLVKPYLTQLFCGKKS